jgi:hypothetical protein
VKWESAPRGAPQTTATVINTGKRTAEDAVEQISEADRFAAAAEHLLLSSLLDGDGIAEAAEGAILLIARARTFLDWALVRDVAA